MTDKETIEKLVASLKEMTFVVESLAHLRGLERELLPLTDASVALMASIATKTLPSQEIERRVITHLITTMRDNGWSIKYIGDGEENVRCEDHNEALDTVFSVDESNIVFVKDGKRRQVVVVLGNGADCLADHSDPGEDDEFVQIMDNLVYPYCDQFDGET